MQGWQRFQVAKQQAESDEIWGKHFTQEDLSDRTGLSLNTLYRVLKRELGVDRQSLEYLGVWAGINQGRSCIGDCYR